MDFSGEVYCVNFRRGIAGSLVVIGLVVLGQVVTAAPAQAGTAAPFDTGRWGQLVNNYNGTCVRVVSNSPNTDASAYSACHSSPVYAPINQLWTLDSVGNGYYRIRNLSSGLCLIAPYWAGYNLVQYTCMGFADQEWSFSVGSVRTRLVHHSTGQCLAAPYWAPGDVVLTGCTDFADQYWNFMAAEYDVEVTNPGTTLGFFWYKARLRRGANCDPQISYQLRDASWTSWNSLPGCTRYRITAAPVPTGGDWAVQAFVRGTDDHIYTNYQRYWNSISQFSGWSDLGGGGVTYSPVEVSNNADNRLQIVVRGSDSHIYTNWQTQAGNNVGFAGWQPLTSTDYASSDPWLTPYGYCPGCDRRLLVYATFASNGVTYLRTQSLANCSDPRYGCWGDAWRAQ
jgi:hypothetical protein